MAALPLRIFLTYIALIGLLILTVGLSFVLGGASGFAASLAIASAKIAMIYLVFMDLWRRHGLTRIFAVATWLWILIMLALTASDILLR